MHRPAFRNRPTAVGWVAVKVSHVFVGDPEWQELMAKMLSTTDAPHKET